tara:strand:+ start:586 stop:1068 length:483 start_codon:yes stop_codon:yes gene_type:complete
MNIKFFRIRKDAKLPVRAHSLDAGMDMFYCPDPALGSSCIWEEKGVRYFRIPPGVSCLVPTGIKVEVPPGHMLEIKNKSGVAHKQKLLVGACVVDSGYTGEVYINLHNMGGETQHIAPGQKLAQAVLTPIVLCGVEETYIDPSDKGTDRGEGGFGSTGII